VRLSVCCAEEFSLLGGFGHVYLCGVGFGRLLLVFHLCVWQARGCEKLLLCMAVFVYLLLVSVF